jgi:uncharacterized membrane protein
MPRSAPRRSAASSGHAALPQTQHSESGEAHHSDSLGLERLVFFSDAVFAIAITLLALDIRLPPGEGRLTNQELLSRLLGLGPAYLSYAISFLVIGSFWMAHHRMFRTVTSYDGRFVFLNLFLLMSIAFVPFPTSVLSEQGNRTATIFYALTIVVVGLLSTLMWWYALRGNRLVAAALGHQEARRKVLRSLIVPTIFLLSIGIAFVNDEAARYSWISIALVSFALR